MGPIDYSSAFGGINPLQAFAQSFQAGAGIREVGLKQDAQEMQLAQQLEMTRVLRDVAANPTPAAIARASVQFPQLSEQFKRSFDMLSSEQQQSRLSATLPVYAAIQAGKPEIAAKQLRERATALQNSGQDAEAKQTFAMADLIEQHPETARITTGLLLSSAMGAEKFADTFGKLGAETRAAEQAPADIAQKQALARKTASEAETAAVTAKFAESNAMMDISKKGWDITKIAADIDIAKQANRIAAMNAQTSRINSDTQRQELGLKITEAKQKLDDKIREKVATAETGAANIDNMLNTIERIKKNPRLKDVVGGIEGRLPGLRNDSIDAIALIKTLGSQAFLAQIPNIKGMGALSNAEGEKLQSALQNNSREQSEGQFRANLDEAARLLKKGRESLSRSTGVPLGKPDTPAAPGARPPLDSFIR